ncbi:endolytic transglycosylase MltG [Yunchengibacter salinarum]|uniref:endolytic transglycosylase MltG n=1 Tax=Yunchengibacter salinarum TaxID=3133399 RepID=UPI0035B636BD
MTAGRVWPGRRHVPALILAALAGAVLLAALALGVIRAALDRPLPLSTPRLVVVEQGQSLGAVARAGSRAGWLPPHWQVRAAARMTGVSRDMHVGEYRLAPGLTLRAFLQKLARGDVYLRAVSLPEGLTSRAVSARLKAAEALIHDLDAPPAEGTLLPETYAYTRGDRASALVARMQAAQATLLDRLWPARQAGLPLDSRREAVILASIVERETAVPEERAKVAAVFINRLNRGMRLQSDPTVRYGLSDGAGLDRPLSRADLRRTTPYNTYRVNGLPPTPIANPGRAALHAVLHPADVPYLYFVADGSGGHAFATTLRDHNRNVARWRAIENARDGQREGGKP